MYKNKTSEEWRKLLIKNLPIGDAYKAANIKDKNLYILYKAFGKIFAKFDEVIAKQFNSFKISPECPYLDNYFDNLNLKRFITKPKNKETLAKIITLFLKAKQGAITSKQMEDLIKEVFFIDVNINILNLDESHPNIFPLIFPINFVGSLKQKDYRYTIVIQFPKTNETSYFDKEDPVTAIKELLKYFINVNYRLIYQEL